ncbi:Similar to Probable ADP-ribosylation factor-binding protein C25H2.16c; acc. no. P87157 [Pyronema omphalodes CBS 100304]|uniref:Similar to Probable ADP-ribosylation factor-binding protein C25H2.16c acc. no. P87157 n=1 Tax=Pyronema omphalodes (strain CBS 100304) TaxID=1076935 RepID=U4LNS4_PYROM|nr:Similar to Probable ADP-ribosylation factor-binding protein C25H2.16c; acc. no. P87157 [Pyronema omphalodes CBS 100304]
MAARDRFGQWPTEPAESQLKRFIRNACDPTNFEPNLALNLEITDLINQKKGTAPREAAVAIVNYINHRNPNVSLLAISLLDICVKNCGYPFHLQISTKDFLNELVRRFPERPPPRPNRVQLKILEAIEEWRQTICMNSRYKDDLGFIRDMHRLLTYKGYTFPEVRREDAAVLNPTEILKSAEEMEEEEREAQSAKLQELIRRGTPQDLQEANHLMKIMAGYDQSSKTDYRAKAAQEIGKLRKKAALLEEMLGKVQPGETIGQQDTFQELASALITAQPKIQKMVEEESDDADAVVKLLELNDAINTIIEKYMLVKKGDINGARALPNVSPYPAASSAAKPAQEDSLIDLLGDEPMNGSGAAASSSTPGPSNSALLQDDLLGLSIDDPSATISQGGGIALGFGANTSKTPDIPGPPLLSSTLHTSTAGMQPPSPQPAFQQIQPQFQQAPPAAAASNAFNFPGAAASLGLSSSAASTPAATPAATPAPAAAPAAAEDDDWSWSEAPKSNEITVLNSHLKVVAEVNREQNGMIVLKAVFSNSTGQAITDLTFQMAVTKAYTLNMQPQTGRMLQPNQKDGIRQVIQVSGAPVGTGGQVKMRWKASYRVGTGPINEEQGVIEGLPVA